MNASTVIVALVLGVIYLVIRQRRIEVREWRDYLDAVREDAINKAELDELHLRPVSDSPAHANIVDLLARNEARRFDPDAADWSDGA